MLLLIASLAATAAPVQPRAAASAQARVSIQILQGYRLIAAGDRNADGRAFVQKMIRGEDGSPRAAKLVEFE
jgi:hypothetical protein